MTSSILKFSKRDRKSDEGISITIGAIMNILISSIFFIGILLVFNSVVWSAEVWKKEMNMQDVARELSEEITEFSLFCERNQISSTKTINVPDFMRSRGYFIELSNSTRALILSDGSSEVKITLSQIPQSRKLQGRAYLSAERIYLSYDSSSSTIIISERGV